MSDASPLRFVLASASPARRKLLRSAGIDPEVLVSGIDESQATSTQPDRLCLQLARLKAEAVVERIRRPGWGSEGRTPLVGRARDGSDGLYRTLVLGCDSVLFFDGEILGKPADPRDAFRRWIAMRGRSGVLYTGHCLIDPAGARADGVAATTVHFADLDDAEIAAYVATGEPLEVAGAFCIDGLGGPFVERIEGDPGTVIGLSLPLLRALLADFGVRISDLWTEMPGRKASSASLP